MSVTAFRAPDFSILPDNLWALELLAEQGFEVDSSIFRSRRGATACPVGVWRRTRAIPQRRGDLRGSGRGRADRPVVDSGGRGGYFRLLPRAILELAVRSILQEDRPVVIYCHP